MAAVDKEKFDKIRKFSDKLKVGLDCEVSADEMQLLEMMKSVKAIHLEKLVTGHEYDVIVGRGKIISTTIYKMYIDQLGIEKIVDTCRFIASADVWSVNVAQSLKPNAWYSKAVGRSMFVYRDSDDFLTEALSGKKVWELDVKKKDDKYVYEVYLTKKIDHSSAESALQVIEEMMQLGNFTMSFALTVTSRSDSRISDVWYSKNSKTVWKISELMCVRPNSELEVMDIAMSYDPCTFDKIPPLDMCSVNASGKLNANVDIRLRMLLTYTSDDFKGDMTLSLDSCTHGTIDDYSFINSSSNASRPDTVSTRFDDLVVFASKYPKQILHSCWLEVVK